MDVQKDLPLSNRRETPWIAFLGVTLFASGLALSWQSRPQMCLSTNLKVVLEIHDQGTKHELFPCSSGRPASYSEEIVRRLPGLNRRVQYTERVIEGFGGAPSNVGRLSLLPDELLNDGRLEKRILGRALWAAPARSVNEFRERQLFLAQVDRFWFDGLRSEDPFVDWEMAYWNEATQRVVERQSPFFRMYFLNEWFDSLYRGELALLSGSKDFPLVGEINAALEGLGWNGQERSLKLAKAVWVARSEFSRVDVPGVAVVTDDRFRPPFTRLSFARGERFQLRVHELFKAQCRWPEIDDLKALGLGLENLVLIQACEGDRTETLSQWARAGNEAQEMEPQLSFLRVHWPSLQKTLAQLSRPPENPVALTGPSLEKELRALGILQNLRFDQDTKVQTWEGSLQPLPQFRLIPPTN